MKPLIITNSTGQKVYAVACTMQSPKDSRCILSSVTGYDESDAITQFINYIEGEFRDYKLVGRPVIMPI